MLKIVETSTFAIFSYRNMPPFLPPISSQLPQYIYIPGWATTIRGRMNRRDGDPDQISMRFVADSPVALDFNGFGWGSDPWSYK